MVRPYASFDNQRNPTSMDRVLEACGAPSCITPSRRIVAEEARKARSGNSLNLIRRLLTEAQRNGAEAIATVCPLCQFKPGGVPGQASTTSKFHIPVLYFTQLLALALGVTADEAGFQRSFINIKPLLAEKEIAYA